MGPFGMDTAVNLLTVLNIMLAIAWFVVGMARMDRAYAAEVRDEHERKSILRGQSTGRSRYDGRRSD